MAFELPDYSSLNPQQVDMINLPTSRNFMIKGSPGTGKTVVAIYRAAQMRSKKVLMLVAIGLPNQFTANEFALAG